jgi:putative nucleotidyltransferase with HDIG domain
MLSCEPACQAADATLTRQTESACPNSRPAGLPSSGPDPLTTQLLIQESFEGLLRTLMARDPETRHHCQRVTRLALRFACFLGLDEAAQETLRTANLLHDIGKIGIHDTILFKPARLTRAERRIIETHPLIGEKLAAPLKLPVPQQEIILLHHERWDGQGYPYRLGEEDIPLLCRISTLADVFDALTTHRPYRRPLPVPKALDEITRQAGKQFDPQLARRFRAMIASMSCTPLRLPERVSPSLNHRRSAPSPHLTW